MWPGAFLIKKEMDFLLPPTYQIPTFYGLPKIHKGVYPLKCRQIVSGINSLSQNIGIYLDEIMSDKMEVLYMCYGKALAAF